MRALVEQMESFKEKAASHVSNLALVEPRFFTDLAKSLAAPEHPALNLPVTSNAERTRALEIYSELQEIQNSLMEAPANKTGAVARWLRMFAALPKDLDTLISNLKALAERLASPAGAPAEEAAAVEVEYEARSFLGKLDAAHAGTKDELKRGKEGHELLETRRRSVALELEGVTTRLHKYESLAATARREKAALSEQTGTISGYLTSYDAALASVCADINVLEKRHADVAALVEKADQRRQLDADNPPDVATVLAYPVKELLESVQLEGDGH
ncbi:unnamed protein product [Urochloa decumbens]|uniref:Uncharacterized protein n=1 Tax=Urochloa decumbens TaxID=240449 RepID=A0ABC8YGH5_9POAL